MAEAVAEEYRSSLAELNFNSKPHINMLTMLAEDNVQYASLIVDTIVNHIKSVSPDLKLPSLYLVDSIMKNIGGKYIVQFSKHMIELFSSVFEKVDEATRSSLYKLRQTWNDILPKTILYAIDCRVNSIDPAWPITAQVTAKSIHVNPKFVSGSPNTVQTLVKDSEIKKTQDDMKKLIEEKTEREKMLQLIEEKKAQLRLLEAKKLQLQHAKLKGMVIGTALLGQKNQSNSVIHRDPRLKKAVELIKSSEISNFPSNPVPTSVPSVVIIPNANSNASTKLPHQAPAKSDANQTEKLSHSSDPRTKANKQVTEESSKINSASSKKRTLTQGESSNDTSNKKHCNNSLNVNSSNMSVLQNNQSLPVHNASDATSKSINQISVPPKDASKLPLTAYEDTKKRKVDADERRPPPIPLFLGSEDKDYRKLQIPVDQPKQPCEVANIPDIKSSIAPVHQNAVNLPTKEFSSDLREKLFVPAEQTSVPHKVSEFTPIHLSVPVSQPNGNFKDMRNSPSNLDLISTTGARGSPIPFTQSFKLDGKDRIIHFVDKRAFAFMDDKAPHEISFIGTPRNVFVEGLPQPLTLCFDQQSRDFNLDGKQNTIQFGTPSREVYINNRPYEIQFGGPPLLAPLGSNKLHHIRVEGPPPQVFIGAQPAYELCERFNKIHNPSLQNPILQQAVASADKALPFQDVDMRLKSKPLQPPTFFESTAAKLKDVDWRQVPSSECQTSSLWSGSQSSSLVSSNSVANENSMVSERCPPPPSFPQVTEILRNIINDRVPQTSWNERPPLERPSLETSSFSPLPPPPRLPLALLTPPRLPSLPSVDVKSTCLTNVHHLDVRPTGLPNMPSVAVRPTVFPNMPSLDVRPTNWEPLPPPPMFPASIPSHPKMPLLPTPHRLPIVTAPSTLSLPLEQPLEQAPPVIAPIDVDSIYEKLVAAGIIPNKEPTSDADSEKKNSSKEKTEDTIKEEKETKIPIIELIPKSLKQFYPGVLTDLYKGSQCATCGMRFKNSQGEQYGRHLDWHFRLNRREKDGAKKAFSRKLFYNLEDWRQFNEIEEVEEQAPSYFELEADGISVKKEEAEKMHSVKASECDTEKCSVCMEQFQLFWVEEEEEWHLRNAVRHDNEVFHPACYEDFVKASKSPPLLDTSKEEEANEEPVKEEEEEVETAKEEISTEIKGEISEESIKNGNVEEKMDADEPPIKDEIDVPIKEEPPSSDTEEPKVAQVDNQSIDENSELAVQIKEEPMDTSEITNIPSNNSPSKIIVIMNDEFLNDMDVEVTKSNTDKTLEPGATIEEQKDIKVEEVEKTILTAKDTGDAENDEDEFRPPTPDPRFNVQPPVFKGTELSALCTIM